MKLSGQRDSRAGGEKESKGEATIYEELGNKNKMGKKAIENTTNQVEQRDRKEEEGVSPEKEGERVRG